MKSPHREGGRGAIIRRQADTRDPSQNLWTPQLARLPRHLFRKIVVEPAADGWRARIVGFDARFWNGATSHTFTSRHMALEAARVASRECGLPVVTTETLASSDPDLAA
jgi:hypothetical protein